jgi:hypothetical protein
VKRKQWLTVLVFLLVGIGGGLALWALLETPKTDDELIEQLVKAATSEYEDADWKALAALTWPPADRADLEQDLGRMFQVRVKPDGDLKLSALKIEGDRATATVTAEGHILIVSNRFSQTFTATFQRHDGRWYIDAAATRKSAGR